MAYKFAPMVQVPNLNPRKDDPMAYNLIVETRPEAELTGTDLRRLGRRKDET
jgi:hypothetical protein